MIINTLKINSEQKINIIQSSYELNNIDSTDQDVYLKDSFNSTIAFKSVHNKKNNELSKAVLEFSLKEAKSVYENLSEQAKIKLDGIVSIDYTLHECGLPGFARALPCCLVSKFCPVVPSKNMGEQALARIMVFCLFKINKRKCFEFPKSFIKPPDSSVENWKKALTKLKECGYIPEFTTEKQNKLVNLIENYSGWNNLKKAMKKEGLYYNV